MSRLPSGFASFASSGSKTAGRFHNDDVLDVSRRIAPLRAAGNVSYVAIVTLDHVMDSEMLKSRSAAVASGIARTMGSVVSPELISVQPDEVVFKMAGLPRPNAGKYDGLQVFSSFNGFELPSNVKTQTELEFAVKVVGVAKIAYSYLPDKQHYDLLSTVCRGPVTLVNRGQTTFAMGDLVRARIYNIDKDKRAREMRGHAPGKLNPNKMTAFLERASYRETEEYAEIGASEFLKRFPAGAARRAAFAADGTQGSAEVDSNMTPAASVMQEMCNSVKAFTIAVIDVLECQGLITVNTPTSEDRLSAKVGNLRSLNDRSDADIVGSMYAPMDETIGTSAKITLADQDKERDLRWAKKRTLAGLIGAANVPGVQAQGGIIQALVLRAAQGLLCDSSTAAEYRDYGLAAALPKNSHNNQVEKQLIARNINSIKQQQRSFYMALVSSHQHIVGVALNAATPGEALDVLL